MKNVIISYSTYTPTIDAILYQLEKYANIRVHLFGNVENESPEYNSDDIIILINGDKNKYNNAIACHYSLLPAFKSDDPVKQALLEGVKVTGITIYYTGSNKILTQYPVFIKNDTNYVELKQELEYLEQIIFPLVIESIINNTSIDISLLLNNKRGCGGNCGGCNGCKH